MFPQLFLFADLLCLYEKPSFGATKVGATVLCFLKKALPYRAECTLESQALAKRAEDAFLALDWGVAKR